MCEGRAVTMAVCQNGNEKQTRRKQQKKVCVCVVTGANSPSSLDEGLQETHRTEVDPIGLVVCLFQTVPRLVRLLQVLVSTQSPDSLRIFD